MDTITVYRVEHPATGHGPWWSVECKEFDKLPDLVQMDLRKASSAANDLCYNNYDEYMGRHPGLTRDFGFDDMLVMCQGWVCACPSLEMLRSWLGAIANELCDYGFTVMAYTFNRGDIVTSNSGTQVAILQTVAVDVNDLTIMALVE